jgi:hypothetical protein
MITKSIKRSLSLVLILGIVFLPICAQQPASPTPTQRKPAPAARSVAPSAAGATIDTLLAADSFKVYGEVKNVGQVLRSGNIADLIDPIMKLADPPKEIKLLVKFANAHAESLSTARMVIAAWPAKRGLPQALMVIELSSADDARKFEAELRGFLPKIIPTPTPSPTPNPTADSREQKSPAPGEKNVDTNVAATKPGDAKPAPPPFMIKQTGALVLLSDTAVDFKKLRPADSRALADDQNFRQVRDRFASEPIFLFFNVALDERARVAAQEAAANEQAARKPDPPATQTKDAASVVVDPKEVENPNTEPEEQSDTPVAVPEMNANVDVTLPAQNPQESQDLPKIAPFDTNFGEIMGALFGGEPRWPEAVGAVIAFDGDSYVARVLLVYGTDSKPLAVPFVPQLISGPAVTLQSPAILPADTEFFVTASIDATQIYDNIAKTMIESQGLGQRAELRNQTGYTQSIKGSAPEPPFASMEKRLGVKFKEELLPVLGNEIAVSIPMGMLTGKPAQPTPEASPSPAAGASPDTNGTAKKSSQSPVVLISLKDKQAAHDLLPRIIDGLLGGGAGNSNNNKQAGQLSKMLAQSEKREDTEIVSYAGLFSYAFIGDFLVLTADTAATRHVVDAYLAHQVLASDSHFRNFTRWQPRQVLGQVYVSPALMESYHSYANDPTALISDQIRDFFRRLGPESEPVTYALSNEGSGPMHELHVPKNLLLMLVASISGEANQTPLRTNEAMARAALSVIAASEAQYRAEKENGGYGTLEQLIEKGMLQHELLEKHGYRIDLTISGSNFEATAVPLEYSKTGMLSYFVDQSSIIRAADHGGGPATVADRPIQ